MRFDKNNTDNTKLNEINIKLYLNRCLDNHNINVSEELIEKTLDAIQNKTAASIKSKSMKEKKIFYRSKYVRRFIGAAAAILIVLVGYGIISNIPIRFNKKALNDSHDTSFEITSDYDKGLGALDSKTSSYTCSEPKTATSSEVPATEGKDSSRSQKFADDNGSAELAFSEVCLLKPEQSAYVNITDVEAHSSISITDQTGIGQFFTIMDQLTFQDGSGTLETEYFTIEIKGLNDVNTLYNIDMGDTMVVKYKTGDSSGKSSYILLNYEDIKKDMKKLYMKYSE
jgi:hypothetical protein